MAKSSEAFRTISEVSEWLETPAHVLRFWESRFNQIKPVKRAGGRRYYRPGDMALLGGIKRLLHDDGITIKGVQKILREKGVKYVGSLSLEHLSAGDDPVSATPEKSEQTPIEAILTDDPAPTSAPETIEPAQLAAQTAEVEAEPDVLDAASEQTDTHLETPTEIDRPPHDQDDETPHWAPSPVTTTNAEPLDAEGRENPVQTQLQATPDQEDRISALYHRLMSLRDRMHSEMVNS